MEDKITLKEKAFIPSTEVVKNMKNHKLGLIERVFLKKAAKDLGHDYGLISTKELQKRVGRLVFDILSTLTDEGGEYGTEIEISNENKIFSQEFQRLAKEWMGLKGRNKKFFSLLSRDLYRYIGKRIEFEWASILVRGGKIYCINKNKLKETSFLNGVKKKDWITTRSI